MRSEPRQSAPSTCAELAQTDRSIDRCGAETDPSHRPVRIESRWTCSKVESKPTRQKPPALPFDWELCCSTCGRRAGAAAPANLRRAAAGSLTRTRCICYPALETARYSYCARSCAPPHTGNLFNRRYTALEVQRRKSVSRLHTCARVSSTVPENYYLNSFRAKMQCLL